MSFFTTDEHGYTLRIKLTPGASACGVRGLFYDEHNEAYLKIYVTTVPEKGKANKELISLLAKKLKIAKSLIRLIRGETDHLKKLHIEITPSAELTDLLNTLNKEQP